MANVLSRFWQELKRRKVLRVAVAYLVIAWLMVEVASLVFPALLLPDWSSRLVVALAMIGFPIALVMAWALQISPEGVRWQAHSDSTAPALRSAALPELAAEAAIATVAGTTDCRRSIVVLPFANMSDAAENEYFSDGVTEEILNLLARQPDLRVISRTTSFSFKNNPADVRTVAGRLGVEMVLEGSVRRAGNRVRIIAQLIDADTDAHLWSDSFDRELEDIFAVQAEIARCIVDAMNLNREACPACEAPTQSIEAYDYYLRGRQYFHTITDQGLKIARQLFGKAIEIDPEFARAYAGLADTESLIAQWLSRSSEHLEAADRASRQALKLAPDLAEAYSSRGFALSLNGDFLAASREFEHALALDPQNYEALYLFGRSRFAEGKLREAASLWERAHATQPDEFQSISLRALALRNLDPNASMEASEAAVAAVRQRLELNPDDLRALSLGCGQMVQTGHIEEGIAMAERALELAPNDIGVLYNAACCFAQAGLAEKALSTLERRLQQETTIYREWVEHDADFDGLRADPRFQALLEKMPRLGG
jgi:adenylate cyclase